NRHETEAINAKLVGFILEFTEEAESKLRGSEQATWLRRLTEEHDNVRLALDWCATSEETVEIGLRIAGAAALAWYMHGRFGEGRSNLEHLITAAPSTVGQTFLAKAYSRAGILAWGQRDYHTAEIYLNNSLDLWRSAQSEKGLADALSNLALIAIDQSRY